jgi:hypothetical protein
MKIAEIKATVKKALNKTKDPVTQYHLRFIHEKLEENLKM